ncbi:hypothetical protein GCM10008934_32380 [Virgibacillus salarius]
MSEDPLGNVFFFTKLAEVCPRKVRIVSRCGDITPIDNMIIRMLSKEVVFCPSLSLCDERWRMIPVGKMGDPILISC